MSEPSFYAQIPATVRYHEGLPPNAKLLYGEITALCNKEGYCWASNAYFANLYKVGPTTISEWVGMLKKAGFIRVEVDQSRGNERKIYLSEALIQPKTPLREIPDTSSGKAEDPSSGKAEHNNTVENNTKSKDDFALGSSDESKKPRKGSGTATQQQVEDFTVSLNMPRSDGTAMFYHFEEKGWGKNWQATIRKWKAFSYLPSQKTNGRQAQQPPPKTLKERCDQYMPEIQKRPGDRFAQYPMQ